MLHSQTSKSLTFVGRKRESIMKKGSKIYSILHMTCPQCHEGKFLVSNVYDLKNVGDVRDECDVCHLKYEREPGFFYGAMYVSYALTVAMAVAIFVVSYLLGIGLIGSFIAIFVVLVALTPLIMRISRLLYINMFVHYKEKKA